MHRRLVLDPVIAESLEAAVEQFAPHGVTMEVLGEALRVLDRRAARAAAKVGADL